MRRAERLFRIVAMFADRRVHTASELAASLEVCERTIYRDIAHLQGSGVGIEGVGGVGYVADERLRLPPLNFTIDQMEALALGASFVAAAADAELACSAKAAHAKIRAILPAMQRESVRCAPLTAARRASARAPAVASVLRQSIRSSNIVEFDYESPSSPLTRRRIQPLAMTACTDVWIVSGWCELRQQRRTFRLDRMRNLAVTGDKFQAHQHG